jgi:hypothetical protein
MLSSIWNSSHFLGSKSNHQELHGHEKVQNQQNLTANINMSISNDDLYFDQHHEYDPSLLKTTTPHIETKYKTPFTRVNYSSSSKTGSKIHHSFRANSGLKSTHNLDSSSEKVVSSGEIVVRNQILPSVSSALLDNEVNPPLSHDSNTIYSIKLLKSKKNTADSKYSRNTTTATPPALERASSFHDFTLIKDSKKLFSFNFISPVKNASKTSHDMTQQVKDVPSRLNGDGLKETQMTSSNSPQNRSRRQSVTSSQFNSDSASSSIASTPPRNSSNTRPWLTFLPPSFSQKVFSKHTFKILLICFFWYLSSAVTNNIGKQLLNIVNVPVMLTWVQFAFVAIITWCFGYIQIFLWGSSSSQQQSMGIRSPSWDILTTTSPLSFFLISGHIFSSIAISKIPVSFAHTIKVRKSL